MDERNMLLREGLGMHSPHGAPWASLRWSSKRLLSSGGQPKKGVERSLYDVITMEALEDQFFAPEEPASVLRARCPSPRSLSARCCPCSTRQRRTSRRTCTRGGRDASARPRARHARCVVNLDPLPFWGAGAQLVALNMQTNDLPVQLHYALRVGRLRWLCPQTARAPELFSLVARRLVGRRRPCLLTPLHLRAVSPPRRSRLRPPRVGRRHLPQGARATKRRSCAARPLCAHILRAHSCRGRQGRHLGPVRQGERLGWQKDIASRRRRSDA